MDKIDDLRKKVDTLTKKVDKLIKLTTDIGKALQLIPVTPEELAKYTAIRMKNEEAVSETVKLIEENTKEDNRVSLFGENQFNDTQSIYNDVLGTDYLGGTR